jgi:lipoate-protein ligase B
MSLRDLLHGGRGGGWLHGDLGQKLLTRHEWVHRTSFSRPFGEVRGVIAQIMRLFRAALSLLILLSSCKQLDTNKLCEETILCRLPILDCSSVRASSISILTVGGYVNNTFSNLFQIFFRSHRLHRQQHILNQKPSAIALKSNNLDSKRCTMWTPLLLRRLSRPRTAPGYFYLTTGCTAAADRHPCFRIHSTLDSGLIDYRQSWAWQHLLLSRRLVARRQNATSIAASDDDDIVFLFEHEPVYTLGRGADENHLTFLQEHTAAADDARAHLSRKNRGGARLTVDQRRLEENLLSLPDEVAVNKLAQIASPVKAPNGAPIYRVERGGEVTFHGPGQLVVYPLMDLKRLPFKDDLHWFLRKVEDVILLTLQEYGIAGYRDEINTGVWVGPNKIAAVGVAASRWITTHGFALNVDPDLSYFDTSVILPCGIDGRGVTSLGALLRERGETEIPTVTQVATVVLKNTENVFGITTKRDTTTGAPGS